MPERISVEILNQTSENVQKLFELSTRIDERVKSIQEKQTAMEIRLESIAQRSSHMMERIAIIESQSVEGIENKMNELDKRITKLESDNNRSSDKWKGIVTFAVQLIWVVVAAFVLLKLNLQAPSIP